MEPSASSRTSQSAAAPDPIGAPGFIDLGFAKIDTDRARRQGFPEVIFCQGKSPAHAAAIFKELALREPLVLATRAEPAHVRALRRAVPQAEAHALARCVVSAPLPQPAPEAARIAVLAAGTADLAVAEEAAVTAACFGAHVLRAFDVGVAGLHRLLAQHELLTTAHVIIAVAGMEGALPSVVAGLTAAPVIAVPTSVGYGAHFQGLAALLAMLNSCGSGVLVCNVDNGFGAGFAAGRIARSFGPVRDANISKSAPTSDKASSHRRSNVNPRRPASRHRPAKPASGP